MIKKLQLYTICIVIGVIVLSQITYMDDSSSTVNTEYVQTGEQQNEGGSKYIEPIEDIDKVYKQSQTLMKKFKKYATAMRELMDFEKSANQLSEMLK